MAIPTPDGPHEIVQVPEKAIDPVELLLDFLNDRERMLEEIACLRAELRAKDARIAQDEQLISLMQSEECQRAAGCSVFVARKQVARRAI